MPWHWSAMKDAKSCDKPRIAVLSDHPWISEWGNLWRATAIGQWSCFRRKPGAVIGQQKLGEVKHLSTLWKRKRNVIPLVAASECGTA